MKDQGASILARLRNKAKVSHTSYQQCLQLLRNNNPIQSNKITS